VSLAGPRQGVQVRTLGETEIVGLAVRVLRNDAIAATVLGVRHIVRVRAGIEAPLQVRTVEQRPVHVLATQWLAPVPTASARFSDTSLGACVCASMCLCVCLSLYLSVYGSRACVVEHRAQRTMV
jgi:hypothetical protein